MGWPKVSADAGGLELLRPISASAVFIYGLFSGGIEKYKKIYKCQRGRIVVRHAVLVWGGVRYRPKLVW